jgi:hypothetical protein
MLFAFWSHVLMAEIEKPADASQIKTFFFCGKFVLHGCDSRVCGLILLIVAQTFGPISICVGKSLHTFSVFHFVIHE